MKIITMTEFRSEPGERIREVQRELCSFLITKSGKPVAMLVPVGENYGIDSDGTIKGSLPITKRTPLGGSY